MIAEFVPATSMMIFAVFTQYFFGITMTLTAIFLILLVLVQRGRGGGLAGAFGGMGGQSAFGTKAGDAFTKITIGASVFWLLLCIGSVKLLGPTTGAFGKVAQPDQPRFAPAPSGANEPLLPDALAPEDSGSSTAPAEGATPANGEASNGEASSTASGSAAEAAPSGSADTGTEPDATE